MCDCVADVFDLVHDVEKLCTQVKLCKPQTSHTIAVFEAIVTSASQLLSLAAPKLQQQAMTSRSDAAVQHHPVASAGKNDAGIFRHQVSRISAVGIL